MRIGVYGGAFSPIHNGHVAAAKAFMKQMWLDLLLVIPTGQSPHKEMDGQASAEDRLRMCELAFAGVDGVIVSDIEMRREGKSYTADTLKALSARYPDSRLFLLLGTDMFLTLDKWYHPEEIFRLSYPVYVRREDDRNNDGMIIDKIEEYRAKYGKVVRKIVVPPTVISSFDIRAAIAGGQDVSAWLDPAVAAYIRERGLYR